MTRVLITGAMGALGLAIIEQLSKFENHQIFATTSRDFNQPDIQKNILYKNAIDLIHASDGAIISLCDISKPKPLKAAFDLVKPDLILHLAASFTNDISDAYRINVAPAIYLLELISSKKLNTRLVLIGSAAEYGVVKPEESPIKEDHTLFPVSAYGVSKSWQTQLLGLYTMRGVDVVCGRIFNLYGVGVTERLFAGRIQTQIKSVLQGHQFEIEVGSLTATRDYISTNEAASQLLTIAKHGVAGNIYHIGSGIPVTIREFLIAQLKLAGLSELFVRELSGNSTHSGYDVPVIFANMQKTHSLYNQDNK